MRSAENLDRIRSAVSAACRRQAARRRRIRGFTAATAAVLVAVLALLTESAAWQPPAARIGWWLALAAAAPLAARWLNRRLPAADVAATAAELAEDLDDPDIRYLVDLDRQSGDAAPALREASLHALADSLTERGLLPTLERWLRIHPSRRGVWIAGFTAVNIAGLALIAGVRDPGAVHRLLNPLTAYERPNPFTHAVTPGNGSVEQGLPVEISVAYTGARPASTTLLLKTGGEDVFRRYPLTGTDTLAFRTDPVFTDLEYRVEMDGYRSETFRLDVALLPRFTDLSAIVTSPAYTRLPSDTLRYPFSTVDVYAGSRISFSGETNVPLADIRLNRRDAPAITGRPGTSHRLDVDITAPDSLWFDMADAAGLANRNRFALTVGILEDTAPVVTWIRPAQDLRLNQAGPFELFWDVRDDIRVERVRLLYRINREFKADDAADTAVPIREAGPVQGHRLDLAALGLDAMDEIEVRVEASDARRTTVSEPRVIRIASLTEQLLAEEEREREAEDLLDEIGEQATENRRRLEELRQDLIDQPRNRSEQMRTLEQMEQERQALDEQVKALQEQMRELREESAERPGISPETQELYRQLEQLMRELDDPELAQALEELRKALETMDPNQLRQAMENTRFNEQRFRERVERTLELYKRLRTMTELDRIAAQLEQLEAVQKALQEGPADADETRQRQQETQRSMEDLRRRLDSLPENAPNRLKQPVQDLSDELQRDSEDARRQLEEQMRELQQERPSPDRLRQQQRRMEDRFQQMRRKTQDALAQMRQQQARVNVAALLGIMNQLLLISDAQESLLKSTENLTQGSAGFIEAARRQNTINRIFGQVSDSLLALSKEVPGFPNVVNDRKLMVARNTDAARRELAERDRGRSIGEKRFVLGGMNEIASLLADLLEHIQNPDDSGGGGGGGMSDALEQMGEDQGQLNQQLQDLLNDMAGERLMQDGMERLDQMARQQNEIRRQLEELRRNGGLDPGDPLLQELEQLAREMEDAINDLRGGAVDRVTVQRQQNILSRMLLVERSYQEREEDERREGEAADPRRGEPPPELTPDEIRERIRRLLTDPNLTRYNEEYQRLIQRYFERLETLPNP
jgi:hypothetical protein